MKRKDAWFIALILLAIVVIFFQLFTLEKAFLSGDHREQQYPWAQFLQSEIHQFRLPWWTSRIQCGFPLLAEGQIGAFYPLNLLFLFFLPLKWAYNYEILFQYLLGALFFYFYMRRSEVSRWGAFFATIIYLFGSTQGGYFYYNLISQKTVIWLPLTLILLDRLKKKRSWTEVFYLALVFTMQLLAGYLQVALYSLFFSAVYFIHLWWREKDRRFLGLFTAAGALAVFFSLAQLLPTFELAMLSSRAKAVKDLAYVGSMSPLGWVTLFYPSWDGFLGSEMYVGILGLFFVFVSLFSEKSPREKFFVFSSALFVLLALGKFSPLYRGLVEITHFYGFRTPIKFLFFATFSCAILAGFGFDKFFRREEIRSRCSSPQVLSGYHFFMVFGGIMLLVPFVTHLFLEQYRPVLLPFFKQYVADHIFGAAGHPHALDFYMRKAEDFYEQVILLAGLCNKHTVIEWGVLGFSLAAVKTAWFLPENFLKKFGKVFCCIILLTDLYFYGFTSIKANYENFNVFEKYRESPIVQYLQRDDSLYRVMEIYEEADQNEKFPVFPNFNMLLGLDDIGAYSPLVMRDYRSFLKGWGYTNDSLTNEMVNSDRVQENLGLLSFLNVKYILSAKPLANQALVPVAEDKGITLYRNEKVLPRAFIAGGVSVPPDRLHGLKNIRPADRISYDQNSIKIDVNAAEDGLLVVSDIAYPGWKFKLNGKPQASSKIFKLFRVAYLKKGANEAVFEYKPVLYQWLWAASVLTILTWAAVLAVLKITGRSTES